MLTYLILRGVCTYVSISYKLQNFKSPYEMLFEKSPSHHHMHVRNCLCYAYIYVSMRDKFDTRSTRCIFLGYPQQQKDRASMIKIAKGYLFPVM